jgi:hypothetical protein
MRKLFTFLSFAFCTGALGQAPAVKLPEFLPPSPDVAAIMKGAELSASPHTGTANAGIPIYDIKIKNFVLPISLNYSSNGFKTNENPSRVGCGWSLNAGGVVSRIQRGKPDDYATTPTPKTISEIQQYDAAALSYVAGLEGQAYTYDAQPDEYRYSVNGMSGKFIIKRDGSVLAIPHNNVKINVVKSMGLVSEIYITDTKGTKYTFGYGGKIEKTLTHNIATNHLNKDELNTAWMLTNITLATGEYINLTYSSIDHRANTGMTTSAQYGYGQNIACGGAEASCFTGVEVTEKSHWARYRSYYVTAIAASTGQSVLFSYEDRPDSSGDNRLYAIGAYYSGTMVKKMELEYNNAYGSTPANETNSKFFLKKFKIKDPTNGSAPNQEYTLKYVYNEFEFETPAGEDHLGFATDGNSSTPQPELTLVEQAFGGLVTNRNPNGEVAKIGMLQKIIYPTGGYDEFHYEPNMSSTWDSVANVKIVSAMILESGADTGQVTYTKTFSVGKTQDVEFHLVSNWMTTPPIPDGSPPATPAPKSAIARVINNANSSTVALRNYYGFAEGDYESIDGPATFELGPGSYTLEVVTKYISADYTVRADIVYDSAVTKTWSNVKEELCGVRVRKVVNYDPVSNKSVSKFYKYEKLNDSIAISAIKLYYPQYISENSRAVLCPNGTTQKLCYSKVYSSNSVSTTYINDAAGVTYKWVIESDDSLYAHGGIEHTFYTEGTIVGGPVLGGNIPDAPTDPYNYRNGLDTVQRYFNSNKEVVKKVKHYYSFEPGLDLLQSLNYMVRKRYTPIITYAVSQQAFEEYDMIEYGIYSAWNHLDSTVTTEYDLVNSKVMTSKVTYTYGDAINVQPATIVTKGSDGVELIKVYEYATDNDGTAVYDEMISRNIIEPVVEEESYKADKLLYRTRTEYRDWFEDGTVLAPEFMKTQKGDGGPLETRIAYYQYATNGNPIELSRENDMRISYIWDYGSMLPIAEIANATYGSGVAYTSFETDAKGGWTFSGSTGTVGAEPGGKKSYSLGGGNITYPSGLTTDAKYIVSYWAESGASVNVNGSAGTLILTKNGWKLYRKLITYSGSGGITVSGSGYIDELRLHPEKAIIKTYTYSPEIGITSAGDNNNLLMKYEYDVYNRLLRIRDMDNYILKQVDYKYGQDITPCSSTTADWVATGEYRCVKINSWGNNNSGYREREEKDKNNCSDTYGQTRWVSVGYSGECPTVSNCTGADKRVLTTTGLCATGCKVFLYSVYYGYLNWNCVYRYEWEDGYKGPEFTESSIYSCTPGVCY